MKALRLVLRAELVHDIPAYRRQRWGCRQKRPIGLTELQLSVRLPLDLISLLVHRAVMPATQQSEIGERRRASLCPMPNVMTLAEAHSAARKATTVVAMLERTP